MQDENQLTDQIGQLFDNFIANSTTDESGEMRID